MYEELPPEILDALARVLEMARYYYLDGNGSPEDEEAVELLRDVFNIPVLD